MADGKDGMSGENLKDWKCAAVEFYGVMVFPQLPQVGPMSILVLPVVGSRRFTAHITCHEGQDRLSAPKLTEQ